MQTAQTTRVSVASDGTEQNDRGRFPGAFFASISENGRYVAFQSYATNLVRKDTNDAPDAFVHDRHTGETRRVSVGSNGREANDWSGEYHGPAVSGDGRYVAFDSRASNLIAGEPLFPYHGVYVCDMTTGQTTRVSVASDGTPATGFSSQPAISADGATVAFYSGDRYLAPDDVNGQPDVYVHDWFPHKALAPRETKSLVIAELTDLLPIDAKTDAAIQAAIIHLDQSLWSDLWVTDSILTVEGAAVFDEEKSAVDELKKVANPSVLRVIDQLTAADSALAHVALADAEILGGDADAIAAGREALVRASEQITKGKPGQAIRSFQTAWELAQLAVEAVAAEVE
jgi:hypothetical protein